MKLFKRMLRRILRDIVEPLTYILIMLLLIASNTVLVYCYYKVLPHINPEGGIENYFLPTMCSFGTMLGFISLKEYLTRIYKEDKP